VPKSLKVKLIAGVLILAKTWVLKWKWWTWGNDPANGKIGTAVKFANAAEFHPLW
jgi:hypothetical protein